ncbi:hypothetical protein J4E93_009156 [Alternaria ventricosa]|uniref:uncharacterized protein n=1 Tax=Alternaria ventricosa TaxID=1187951 RepID=UPI0020C2D6C7|nr:uncharacterized protein J4E93_009156 [Alternaria ventricosa]KAI4639802.1 hypothetical protein J4E93_009156 [Alternaria ventricosa]
MSIDYQRDYAFSYALYGVRSPPKEDHVLLRVQHWSSSADRTGRKVGTAADTSQEEENIVSADHEEVLGLWVGLRPARGGVLRQHNPEPVGDDTETQTALAEIKDKIKKTKNTTPRSVDSLSELGALPIWPLEADMTRVVVKYNPNRADKITYFELVNRDPVTKVSS